MYKPLTIGIGGGGSGAGKTVFASKLLSRLKREGRYGAIKCTNTPLYASVIDAPEVLGEEGKDTARLMEAGAEAVLWVKSPREGLKDALNSALDRLSGLDGIIIEGNSAIEVLRPDIVIFIVKGGKGLKPGAERVLSMADAVIDPGGEEEEYLERVMGLINERKNNRGA